MASILKLDFLLLQVLCLTDIGHLNGQYFDNYDLNNLDLNYSDYDYDLPQFWEDRHSRKTTKARYKAPWDIGKLIIRQKKLTGKTQVTTKATKITTTTQSRIRDLRRLYFQSLESYEVQTTPVSEDQYPWIAKVVHSKSQDYPYVCTAVCIEKRIFITAGRCLTSLKLATTTVLYQNDRFLAKAFVLPDKPSKQLFDDVGIIVTYDSKYRGEWPTVPLFNGERKDGLFQWFADLNYTSQPIQHKVIGYTTKKYVHIRKQPNTEFKLTELDVVVDIYMCDEVFSRSGVNVSYFVPCYHSCTLKEYKKRSKNCQKYHGTEGGAVYNFKTNTLLGLASWGSLSYLYELPVGFTVPNSDGFYKDLACAQKIMKDRIGMPHKGYYQGLCDEDK